MPQLTSNRLKPKLKLQPGFSMSLASYELDALHAAAVFTRSHIKLVRQTTGRLILSGEESGGAGKNVGHYVGYAPIAGWPFLVDQPIRHVPNAQHRRIFGCVMIRFEVFRYDVTHMHTQISLHTVLPTRPAHKLNGKQRAEHNHSRRILFLERFGVMGEDGVPAFISSAGETTTIPGFLLEGFKHAFTGSLCVACYHSHLKAISPIVLPPEVLNALAFTAESEIL
jgi:hypothetical protein